MLVKSSEPVKISCPDTVIVRYKANPDGDLRTLETSTNEEAVKNKSTSIKLGETASKVVPSLKQESVNDPDREFYEQQQSRIDRQLVNVLSENQFFALMGLKQAAREWVSIDFIQTCVKSNYGIGQHLPLHFSMQIDLDDQRRMLGSLSEIGIKTSLEYNFKQIGKEYEQVITDEATKLMI